MGFCMTLQVSSISSARLKFLSDFCNAYYMAVSKTHSHFVLHSRLRNISVGCPWVERPLINQSSSIGIAQGALAGRCTCAMLVLSLSGTFTPA